MEFKHIVYEPGKIARIIFNRSQCLNAQGFLLLEETDQAFKLAEADKACGAIVLSGAGRAFSAGHDIGTEEDRQYREGHGYSNPLGEDRYPKFQDMRSFYVEKTLAWRNSPKPTVPSRSLAGTPSAIDPVGTTMPLGTTALEPTSAWDSTTAPWSTTDPFPTKA